MGVQAKDHRQKHHSPPPTSHHCLTKGLVTKIIYLLLPLVFLHFYFFPRPVFPSFSSNGTIAVSTAVVTNPKDSADTSTTTSASAVGSTTAAPAPPATRCDYSHGRWVPSSTAPLYNGTSCSTIKAGQNCMAHGRPDTGYLQWRWQPEGSSTSSGSCALPPFSPSTFLSLLSNRHLAFVGDSMARNQLESLLCLLSSNPSDPPPRLVYRSGDDNKFRRWRLDARNATVSVHWSPFLVRGREKDPGGGGGAGRLDHNELYLDEVDTKWASETADADVVVLSVGHWFLHPAVFYEKEGNEVVGCHYCPGLNHTEVGFYEVYRKAFRTALNWLVDHHQKPGGKRKYAVATTFSPAHFEGEWDKAGACPRKEPYGPGEKELEGMDAEMWQRQLEEASAAERKAEQNGGLVTVEALDVTRMALMRPDGHPGPYMNPFPFGQDGSGETADKRVQNDCVHWCLPGPIDAWNEVFLMMLKRWSEENMQQQQPRSSTQW